MLRSKPSSPNAKFTNSSEFVYGRHAVIHLLKASRRRALCLHLLKNSKTDTAFIVTECQRLKIPIRYEEISFFEKKFGGFVHQGVVLETGPYPYISLEEILNEDLILLLDEIQDTQNLGALCRSAELLGVGGIILPETNSASINAGACHASVGAVEYLKIARISSIAKALEILKEHQFWVYGAAAEGEKNVFEEQFPKKVALVMGSEERGLRKLVRERCDFLLKIPMIRDKIGSFNASVAGGIFLYEIIRQKWQKT